MKLSKAEAKRRAAKAKRTRAKTEADRSRKVAKSLARVRKTIAAKTKARNQQAGDLASLSIAVYGPGNKRWDPAAVLDGVTAAINRKVAGRVVAEDHPRQWRSSIVFPRLLTAGELLQRLARVRPEEIELDGGRFNLGAMTKRGVMLPLSKAYTDPASVLIEAVDSLTDNVSAYRPEGDDDDDGDEWEPDPFARDAMEDFTRRSEAATKGWVTRRERALACELAAEARRLSRKKRKAPAKSKARKKSRQKRARKR